MLRVFADPKRRESLLSYVSQECKMNDSNEMGVEMDDVDMIDDKDTHIGVKEGWVTAAKAHWKNQRVAFIWLFLYMVANVAAFTDKAVKYARHDEAQAVFGHCIVVARGSAQVLNLNACVILLPICRHLLTRLRATKLRFLFPFDLALDLHILAGAMIALFTTAHVASHLCNFNRFAHADQDDLVNLLGNEFDEIPDRPLDRWILLLRTRAGITGLVMVVCMIIAFPMILLRRKNFNTFWVTHHLFLIMLIALCFHGTGNSLEHFQSVYWIMLTLGLYIFQRILRQTSRTTTTIRSVSHKGGNVLGLKLEKPANWDKHVRAGMYAYLNVPELSWMEWHPFTLTSCPHDDFIEFHIRRCGDWTGKLHDLLEHVSEEATVDNSFENGMDNSGGISDVESPSSGTQHETKKHRNYADIIVKVEGPIGDAPQGFKDYPVVILVGAGIGVTPMISVLKQLLNDPGKMKRTYLYWTARDRVAFEWFSSLMDEIYMNQDKKNVLQIRHFLTSMKHDNRDLGSILLEHTINSHHKHSDYDILLGRHVQHQVEVGRPDWKDELKCIRDDVQRLSLGKKCGIFFCGPDKMGDEIERQSFDLSTEDPKFHFYFNKNNF